MIFETHAHYEDKCFDEDREEVLARVRASRVFPIINVASSVESAAASLALARANKDIYAALGVHPSEISGLNEETYRWLSEQSADARVAAVGEIGLDYHWDKDPQVQERQRYWFARQLQLARAAGLPVIVHSRDAAEDTLRVMRENRAEELSGVIHCYGYSPELAREFTAMGWYIGVGGVVTFKNAKKLVRTVEEIPLERILLETDCPYMAPEPHRGTRNDSSNLPYVIAKIAEIKGVSADTVESVTGENAYRLFARIQRACSFFITASKSQPYL